MKTSFGKQVFIVLIFLFLLAESSNAQTVSSTELIEKAKFYNNKIVEYQGEAVGDVMARGDYCWVNLNDGQNAVGIWAKTDLISPLIKYKGDYNNKGDIVFVKGIFHRACPQHGGDLDIHIAEAFKIKQGSSVSHRVNLAKVISALSLFLTALGLSVLYNIRRKRKI